MRASSPFPRNAMGWGQDFPIAHAPQTRFARGRYFTLDSGLGSL
jgi:hypothetical protein